MTGTIPLGELITIRGGGTPSRSIPAYWNGAVRWATVKDFKSTELAETQESITPEGICDSATNVIPAGSVIVPTRMAVGKAAINTIDLAINQDLKALLPGSKVDPRFLLHFMLTQGQYLESQAQGATVKGIKLDLLRSLPFPKISPSEQRRIAAILDKADAIRRKRELALALADDFLRSVFLEMFGDPGTNPLGLPQRALANCSRLTSGATPSKANAKFWDGRFPWVSPKDMKVDTIWDAEDHVSELVFEQTNLKKIPPGTPLIVVRGMILAHTVPLAMSATEVAINQDMKAIHFDSDIDPMFGFWCLKVQHDSILGRVDTAAHGTKRLDTDRLGEVMITVPRDNAQQEFLAVVRKFREMRTKLVDATAEASDNFAALSQRAFRGEL
ncbi:restriction endonuclease subunit S [Sphingorhabdus sp.]|uniref:restriction endonuclease subunit S n=1 Tax=Sphingorhabdus sp. TaxID=1902408 RepID=UPI0032B7388E